MMAQFAFDTLSFVKRLAAAGMDSRQAEALAEALTENAFTTLATKADLKELELVTKAELRDLELRLKAELRDLELRLNGRMGAMIAGSTALTVAILGALITLS